MAAWLRCPWKKIHMMIINMNKPQWGLARRGKQRKVARKDEGRWAVDLRMKGFCHETLNGST